jgi:RecA-family ATPase
VSVAVTNSVSSADSSVMLTKRAIRMIDIRNKPRSEPDWIIPGLLKRENVMFMIGAPKLGKSWLLLHLACDLASGEPVWHIADYRGKPTFQAPRPMRVLYFAQEDTQDDLQDRLLVLNRELPDNLWAMPKDLGLLLDTPEGVQQTESIIAGVHAEMGGLDLVIFDPFRRVLRGDENSSAVTASLWRQLDEWGRKFKTAFLFAHHIAKPPKDKDARFDETSPFAGRGSGDIFGGADAFVNVVEQGKRTELAHRLPLRLHFKSKRAAPVAPVNLVLDIPNGAIEFLGFATGRPARTLLPVVA